MPSFSIEVQGETIPLTAQSIYATLIQASSGSLQGVKVAAEQLSNWEKQPGYFSLLQDVYADLNLDQDIRFQAIIQLKNGVDKHWRKTSTNAIGKDEKAKIRSQAIPAGIAEPALSLALHNALMLGKIVRYDFPHDWPDVITTLIDYLRRCSDPSTESQYTTNILTITLQIIKELGSGKLQRTKRSLQQVALELFQVLGQLYVTFFSRWTSFANSLDANQMQIAKNSYTTTKILRRLLVAGFEHPHREDHICQFWKILQNHQTELWGLWQGESGEIILDLITKHLLQQSKLHLEMARNHAAAFVLLPGSMDILSRSWNTITLLGNNFESLDSSSNANRWKVKSQGEAREESSPLEKLALKALLLFRASLKMVFNPAQTFRYQHPPDKEDRKLAVELIKSKVLTEDIIISIMETLVTKYFVLRPSDLRDWETEPDEWERREDDIADAWEYAVRPCSEKLFLDLIVHFKELLVPKLLRVFYQYASLSNADVFLKESLYSAIGIAAACLEDKLDFNAFLCDTLAAEVQVNLPHYSILRRRTTILLGQWVPIKPASLDRQTIYQIFSYLLSKEDSLNDSVVRVTAGRQLSLVLDPFEFEYTDFAPYASAILQRLMSLIAETELTETKMALLETMRIAATKLGKHVEPYAGQIVSLLPELWADSGEEHLMKQGILTMITAIMVGLGPKSTMYHSAFVPLIRDSVRPDSEARLYLIDEALDLWAAIIQQAYRPSGESDLFNNTDNFSYDLRSLCESLIPLLETTDTLRQTLELLESYILLSPSSVLAADFLIPTLTSMSFLLDVARSTRAREIANSTQVLEKLVTILSTPNKLILESLREVSLRHLIDSMVQTGYLSKILGLLREASQYHQDPQPSKRPPDFLGPAETALFSILARIALASPSMFLQAVYSCEQSTNIDWLIIEWVTHFDSIGDIMRKKLQALALTNLLNASNPPPTFMLEQLQSLITIWTDILTELGFETAAESEGDYLWQGRNPFPDSPEMDESPEDGRKRMASQIDPTYTMNMRSFVADKIHAIVREIGGDNFQNEWLNRVDGAVLNAFADLNVM